jgi:hypothetical protein
MAVSFATQLFSSSLSWLKAGLSKSEIDVKRNAHERSRTSTGFPMEPETAAAESEIASQGMRR